MKKILITTLALVSLLIGTNTNTIAHAEEIGEVLNSDTVKMNWPKITPNIEALQQLDHLNAEAGHPTNYASSASRVQVAPEDSQVLHPDTVGTYHYETDSYDPPKYDPYDYYYSYDYNYAYDDYYNGYYDNYYNSYYNNYNYYNY